MLRAGAPDASSVCMRLLRAPLVTSLLFFAGLLVSTACTTTIAATGSGADTTTGSAATTCTKPGSSCPDCCPAPAYACIYAECCPVLGVACVCGGVTVAGDCTLHMPCGQDSGADGDGGACMCLPVTPDGCGG